MAHFWLLSCLYIQSVSNCCVCTTGFGEISMVTAKIIVCTGGEHTALKGSQHLHSSYLSHFVAYYLKWHWRIKTGKYVVWAWNGKHPQCTTVDRPPICFPQIPMWPPLLNVAPLVLPSPLNPSRIATKTSPIAIKPSATPPATAAAINRGFFSINNLSHKISFSPLILLVASTLS